ncbi:MAG: DUF262 domain-containing protein [Chitinophaga sp.]|uniref:DUF262 domain-containing protein n=1 Tax=Chitinophaga sp. TaxID=1869181 RepID=UPI0025B99BA8|nr:DUF262 domain-containing protein [Chitinophaga sp.]MBV8252330.1 DUF262 domain-containing protein [Chitinophaga sp.]
MKHKMNKYNIIDILSKEVEIETNNETKCYKFDGIQIPMIQRDYAQGRIDEIEIRERFLNSIFHSLRDGKFLDLDFVYGSIKRIKGSTKSIDNKIYFVPLDGQQRLTTLFLLHWYIGNRELANDQLAVLRSSLRCFSYDTRISARKFCEILSTLSVSFKQKPAKEIKDQAWFYSIYEKDPTVKSMLVMLDAIHEHYENSSQLLYSKLNLLSFYILPLDGFNLSDELYIKMNARGKQLTDFENFKADLINWLQDNQNPFKNEFATYVVAGGRSMPYHMSFAQKLDNEWTNLFWGLIKNNAFGNTATEKAVDPFFNRFFYRYLLNRYILASSLDHEKIGRDEVYQKLQRESGYAGFHHFKDIFSQENVTQAIEKILDCLSSNWNSINEYMHASWNERLSLFEGEITQSHRVLFLAVTLYVERFDYDETCFKQWMRVVWNIVANTDINDVSSMVAAMKVVNELSLKANKIYSLLSDAPLQLSSSKEAIEEERQKASFIRQNITWEKLFIEAESHLFFKGSIGFLISPEMSEEDFTHRKEMAFQVFDQGGVNEKYREDHLFLRALISRFEFHIDLIGKNFTDKDEREHYLKRMLSSNKTVKQFTVDCFSLPDEMTFMQHCSVLVQEDSRMNAWDSAEISQWRIRTVHEALYKHPWLQNWMQEKNAIRIGWKNDKIYASRPSAWYDWVMLDTYRNQLISILVQNYAFSTGRQCIYKHDTVPYYWGTDDIVLEKTYKGNPVKLIFTQTDGLKVSIPDLEYYIDNFVQEVAIQGAAKYVTYILDEMHEKMTRITAE